MKMTGSKNWMSVCAAVLAATVVYRASADDASANAPAAKPDKIYTGTVNAVDPNERALDVKGFMLSKEFNLGDNCVYALWNKPAGTIGDLRPGEKVTVAYQDTHGVLVADNVKQVPMTREGMVKSIDPAAHTMTVHVGTMDKQFRIADDCDVVLRNGKSGTFADIQTGNQVTVTYETPNGALTARQIARTSIEFTGTLTAIDLGEKTLKAKAMFGTKKFNVADNCAIVINGKADGQLGDLKPNDKLVFSYDEINGVNVVNRITPAAAPAVVTTDPPTSY
jgi:Cu/Ag efflux protein CusF